MSMPLIGNYFYSFETAAIPIADAADRSATIPLTLPVNVVLYTFSL